MGKEALISIIVPVYKVEKYLNKCIQSIVDQTYQNIEIILVDDGSPDACPQICDEWSKRDSRIHVIHKENGGLSSARNAGMSVASGDYIGFIDSDDYIDKEMYSRLYNVIQGEMAELAICSCELISEDGEILNNKPVIKNEVFSGKQALEKIVQENGWYYVTVWNKLYSRKILEGLQFPIGKIHEDEFIVHHIFGRCTKIVSIEEKFYKYVQRSGSIMKTPNLLKRLDAIEAFCDRVLFLKKLGMESLISQNLSLLKSEYIKIRMQLVGFHTWINWYKIKKIDRLFCKTYFSNKKNVAIKEKIILSFPIILYFYFNQKIERGLYNRKNRRKKCEKTYKNL